MDKNMAIWLYCLTGKVSDSGPPDDIYYSRNAGGHGSALYINKCAKNLKKGVSRNDLV